MKRLILGVVIGAIFHKELEELYQGAKGAAADVKSEAEKAKGAS